MQRYQQNIFTYQETIVDVDLIMQGYLNNISLIHVQDSHTCEMTVSHMHQIIQSNLTIHALLVPCIYI